jgi:predicted small secreted protein
MVTAKIGAVTFQLTERNAMWRIILFGLMSLASIALSACNTIEGAGKDVTAAGREVSEEAREHKRY